MGEFTIAEIGEHSGRELGVSEWVTIDQSRIYNFADCTGDHAETLALLIPAKGTAKQ